MSRWARIAVGGSLGLAAILTIALVVAIASGDEEEPTPETTQAAPQTFGGPLGGGLPPEVEECLSEQGVEAPGSDGGIPSESEIEHFREAIDECGLPAPQIFTPGS